MDLTDLENQAMDILAFDGEVKDTLAEFRRTWGEFVPALMDGRFDDLCLQYLTLPHEQGVQALGQELTAWGWGLYDFDDEYEYRFVLVPETEWDAFETLCRRKGHPFRLMKQPRRKWGTPPRSGTPDSSCPARNMSWTGNTTTSSIPCPGTLQRDSGNGREKMSGKTDVWPTCVGGRPR